MADTAQSRDVSTFGVEPDDYDRFIKRRANTIALGLNVKLMTPVQAAEAEKLV